MRTRVPFTVACLALAAALVAGAPAARAQVPVLHLEGRGFGHGVGLAQWGAKYAADGGADVGQILTTFYPGTSLGQAGGPVRVAVYTSPGGEALLQLPQGGEVRSPREGAQAPGFPVVVEPGGSVTVRFDGSYRVTAGVAARTASPAQCLPVLGPCPTTTTTSPDGGGGGGGGGEGECGLLGCPSTTQPSQPASTTSTTAAPEAAPSTTGTTSPPGRGEAVSAHDVWVVPAGGGVVGVPARGRSYRGIVQAVGGGGLRLVNEVDVETYLKGMGEVPASWPAAAQQAQAIAARTWVLRAMRASGEVCDYDRCQVYIGAGREAAAQSAAVDATRGAVLTYGGALAATVYSADAGGTTATTFEGFGTPDGTYPYLTTVRYDTPDPLPWSVDVALTDLARRFGYGGTVTGVRVTQSGPSGRALEVALDGTAGSLAVPGRQFASGLGLRSTLFTATIGDASVAPAPPPADAAFADQALPDDTAAIEDALADAPTTGGRADVPSRAERAAGIDLDAAAAGEAARDLADNPIAVGAVATLGILTAAGMARLGGLVPAGGELALVGGRLAPPAVVLPSWRWPRLRRRPAAPVDDPPPHAPAPRVRLRLRAPE